jgi:hypothetical protein
LAVKKQAAQKFDGECFNLRKLHGLDARKQYQIEISNKFAALVNLSDSEDTNSVWENIKENIKTSPKWSLVLCEMKHHKPEFHKECLRFLDQRKQAKVQWVQDSNQSNTDNLNNVSRNVRRHLREKKKNLKVKINELENNNKIKKYLKLL